MKIFGLVGWSGSGKTTLLVKLLPLLVDRGLRVSTCKHAHHVFDVDKPGKDSYRHREAGATEVMISSSHRWALMHELRDGPEPELDEIAARMSPVDLLLVEGFKRNPHEKMEIYRAALGKPMLASQDKSVVALASDGAVAGTSLPVLDLNDADGIAAFIVRHCGLEAR